MNEDKLFLEKAKQIIQRFPKGYAGTLQEHLSIGYTQASRLLDLLAKEDYIVLRNGDYELKILPKVKKDPFEIIVFLLMTPMYTNISAWITIPLGFLQNLIILVLMLILFNPNSATTAIRIPLSGGGIIGALLSIGVVKLLLEFIYNNLFLSILVLLIFYVYAFATKRPPKFTWTKN